MDINFELYKIFYHTVTSSSFSNAAEKLFITQSAVSQAIKNLESKIGATLFFRHNRNLKLTPEGEMLFTHIEQAYNFIKTGEQKLTEIQNLDSGEIRIGASDTVCKYFLMPYLENFHRLYPKVKLQFINRTSPKILDNLKNGSIDLGIVTLPLNGKNVTVYELTNVTDIFVAAPKYNELKDRQVKLAELAGYPLLLLEKASSTRRNFDGFLQDKQLNLVPEIELESVDLLVEFARIGMGVAHVLKESALAPIENGELFEIKTAEKIPQRQLGLVIMRQVPLSKAAEVFVNLLNC
ncbi:MAG: LysR family transcriptional regulator [Firmicutes bacterium]|mgnify:CR=1 FL=1|nr:LysR family transcriptional regulator [Bacillota bacterium]